MVVLVISDLKFYAVVSEVHLHGEVFNRDLHSFRPFSVEVCDSTAIVQVFITFGTAFWTLPPLHRSIRRRMVAVERIGWVFSRFSEAARRQPCPLCAKPMRKAVKYSGQVAGLIVGLILIVAGVAAFILLPCVGWVPGPLLGLMQGGKRMNVWRCKSCKVIVPRG